MLMSAHSSSELGLILVVGQAFNLQNHSLLMQLLSCVLHRLLLEFTSTTCWSLPHLALAVGGGKMEVAG